MPYLVDPVVPPGALGTAPQPQIAGNGVTLRPWRGDDAPALAAAYADPQIQQWHAMSLDEVEARALIARWSEAWRTERGAGWAVVDPDEGVLLGRVGFRVMHLADGAAEVTYWTAPWARRRGVAVAAVRALCRWALGEAGLHRLDLLHSTRNPSSCRVAEVTGFTLEGTMRSAVLHPDGWHDMHLHGLVREDR